VARLGEQVAEALDYAHQRGVVHRDVKPGNVLIDERGAAWLTDFGLAHVQHAEASLTLTGDMVGTLRYMSPEQALAKRVVIDHRTDVYSLGATLYELLTLRPPFTGEGRQELLRQIAFEEPLAPRRLAKDVPAELETIVLKALEKNPQDRYATAQDLADDLRRWLEDRPIRARRPTLGQVAARWVRRRRSAAAAAAVCLVVSLAALAGSVGWVLGERRARQRDAEARALEALQDAAPGLRQGNPHDPALVAAAERAGAQLDAGAVRLELRERVEQLQRDREMLAGLETARLQRAAGSKDTAWDHAGADGLYARAFRGYGLDVPSLDAEEAARRIRASAIRTHLVVALDDWAFIKEKLRRGAGASLGAVANLADDDPWRGGLRRAFGRGDRAALEALVGAKGTLGQPPGSLVLLARALKDARSVDAAERLLRRAQAEHPGDFWVNFELAETLAGKKPSDHAQAIRFYQAALALRPRSPVVYTNLGNALSRQGKAAEAEAAFHQAIALKPDLAQAHSNLGNALREQGKLVEAVACYREALRLEPDFPLAHNNLGAALQAQGKPAEAVACYREALRLKPDLPEAHYNLGAALQAQGKQVEAVACYREALRLKPDFTEAHCSLGNALFAKKDVEGAIRCYREAIRVDPSYAKAYTSLGLALHKNGDLEGAIHCFKEAIRLGPRDALAHENLGNAQFAKKDVEGAIRCYREAIRVDPSYAKAHSALGVALGAKGDVGGAIRCYREAIRLNPRYALAHGNLGVALYARRDVEGAIHSFREAIRLKPDYHEAHNNLGAVLKDQGKVVEAVAAFKEALRLKPDFPLAHYNLGVALQKQGKPGEAVACYREALRLEPDYPQAHYNLGVALLKQGKLAGAEAAFRKAIALQRDYAEAHCNLGHVLRRQGRFADALAALKRGNALGRRRPDWPFPSARWVREAKRLMDLDAQLPKFLSGEAQPAGADERLALAQLCQEVKKRYAAASRFYADAFAAQPKWAENLDGRVRYNAACAAALAGCGEGTDAAGLAPMQRMHWRRQALTWLRADLRAWQRLLDREPVRARAAVGQTMRHWLADPDFAGVRRSMALRRLPAEDRAAWTGLWADVAQLRDRTKEPTPRNKESPDTR
jgi:superkiller protein 3